MLIFSEIGVDTVEDVQTVGDLVLVVRLRDQSMANLDYLSLELDYRLSFIHQIREIADDCVIEETKTIIQDVYRLFAV